MRKCIDALRRWRVLKGNGAGGNKAGSASWVGQAAQPDVLRAHAAPTGSWAESLIYMLMTTFINRRFEHA
jgi:hypothetical protein